MSESDLEFVERMRVRGAWAPDSDMARLFSLARRGAETQWRRISGVKGKAKLGTVAVFGGQYSHSNSPELLTGHVGPSVAKWDDGLKRWYFSDWPYGDHIYSPTHFIPLSALGEPE